MSKIYAEQVMKAQNLAKGLKNNYESVNSRTGITLEQIECLGTMATEAAAMNAEVEELRKETNLRATIANQKLEAMKDLMFKLKRLAKGSFDNNMWMELGIPDKR